MIRLDVRITRLGIRKLIADLRCFGGLRHRLPEKFLVLV